MIRSSRRATLRTTRVPYSPFCRSRGRAVGVPDPVGGDGAGAGGRLDGQDLVAADAGVAVGQRAAQFRRWPRGAVAQVEDDEIIAGAVQIGRAHVCTPITNATTVCQLSLSKKNEN